MVRRENGGRVLPAGPDVIQVTEIVVLVVVVIVINGGTVLQLHLVQRTTIRYCEKITLLESQHVRARFFVAVKLIAKPVIFAISRKSFRSCFEVPYLEES